MQVQEAVLDSWDTEEAPVFLYSESATDTLGTRDNKLKMAWSIMSIT